MNDRVKKLGELGHWDFLSSYDNQANETYKDFLPYVDNFLLSNYYNILVHIDKYDTWISHFIPAHDKEFTRIAKSINSEYDPTANYDMIEEEMNNREYADYKKSVVTNGEKITDRNIKGTTTTETENSKAVINSDNIKLAEKQKITTTPNAYGETTKENYNAYESSENMKYTKPENFTRKLTRKGNIGVTTTQQMIESTFELEKYNKLLYYITSVFIQELTLGVYDFD